MLCVLRRWERTQHFLTIPGIAFIGDHTTTAAWSRYITQQDVCWDNVVVRSGHTRSPPDSGVRSRWPGVLGRSDIRTRTHIRTYIQNIHIERKHTKQSNTYTHALEFSWSMLPKDDHSFGKSTCFLLCPALHGSLLLVSGFDYIHISHVPLSSFHFLFQDSISHFEKNSLEQ